MNPAKENNIATSAIELFSSLDQPEHSAERHIADWQGSVTLMLDERGLIHDCSNSSAQLFGYQRGDLVLQHFSMLFPQLSQVVLVVNGNINSRLSFLCHCGHHFMAQGREGRAFLSKLSFVLLEIAGKGVLKLIVWPEGNAAPA